MHLKLLAGNALSEQTAAQCPPPPPPCRHRALFASGRRAAAAAATATAAAAAASVRQRPADPVHLLTFDGVSCAVPVRQGRGWRRWLRRSKAVVEEGQPVAADAGATADVTASHARERLILRSVSGAAACGELVGVLGPSGAAACVPGGGQLPVSSGSATHSIRLLLHVPCTHPSPCPAPGLRRTHPCLCRLRQDDPAGHAGWVHRGPGPPQLPDRLGLPGWPAAQRRQPPQGAPHGWHGPRGSASVCTHSTACLPDAAAAPHA